MGKALYRKYRSKKLSEIVGQEHITTALSNALKNGKISHAYLFTGPRGVGKTSIARILAHELNGLEYDEEATHLDIIEIDAASNRRIDEIRELRDKVHNAPASAKYKVYIIDEVHMLTREAFNALLKTLEEPPEHAIFILATTEAHKLPETIISRTQRYSFRPIELVKAVNHLKSIAETEKINITADALELIALHGDGSFRDSISLLDQVRNSQDKVTIEAVQNILGIAPADILQQLLEQVANGNPQGLVSELTHIKQGGYHPAQVAKQLAQALRQQLLDADGLLSPTRASSMLKELIQVPAAHDPERLLEIVLLEATLASVPAQAAAKPTPAAKAPPKAEKKPDTPGPGPEPAPKPQPESIPEAQEIPKLTGILDDGAWQEILLLIKAKHNTLYSVARMAVPTFDGNNLTLAFSFPFHQKRLNDSKNRQIISDIIQQATGLSITINCIVEASVAPPALRQQPDEPKQNDSLETISNIFGSAEMLE